MRIILWITFVALIGSYICGPVIDPDLWWHITVGRWILAHGTVPHVDYWNMFAVDLPWRAYSWLSEILFAWVDNVAGDHGLLSLQIIFAVLLAASLFFCFAKIADDWFFGGVLGIFATAATYNHFTLRPQSLVWIFFMALVALSTNIQRTGLNLRRGLGLIFIMCLWANTHITTALGLGVATLWMVNLSQPKTLVLAAQVAGLCFLGTLLTPYHGGEWLTFFSKTGHPFQHQAIAEFQAATIMQHSTAFLIIALSLLIAWVHQFPRRLQPLKLLLCGAFCIAGLAIVKFLPFAVILLCCLIAEVWKSQSVDRSKLGNIGQAFEELRKLLHKFPKEGLSFLLLCVVVLKVFSLWRQPIEEYIVPVKAVDFIQQKQLPHPVLNAFGNGGYLMYRFSDQNGNLEHRVTIDGRTNVVPHEIWENYMNAELGKNNWRDYFEKVEPQTILWKSESPLTSILLYGHEWCEVFRSGDTDHGYTVYVKNDVYQARKDQLSAKNCS